MNALVCAIFAVLAVSAIAGPLDNSTPVPILSFSADGPNPDGSYAYSYETGDGSKKEEQGQPKKINETEYVIVAQGSYSYQSADGTPIAVSYIADENGFQPQGDHLPTPPPIPAGILKALEYIAAHPEQDNQ